MTAAIATRLPLLALILVLVAPGCGGEATTPDTGATDDGPAATDEPAADTPADEPVDDRVVDDPVVDDDTPAPLDAPLDAPLIVHEWGTFSFLVGSDGAVVEGLHHDEEALPGFVERRTFGWEGSGADELLPEGATVKLQNPVVFAHTDGAGEIRVDVDWPEGVFTAAWPPLTEQSPAPGGAAALADGAGHWDALAGSSGEAVEVLEGAETLWTPMRTVGSAPVTAGGAEEQFLYFSGIGRAELPVVVDSQADSGQLLVTPADGTVLARAWYVWVHAGGGLVWDLGEVSSTISVVELPTPKEHPALFYEEAVAVITGALMDEGLYEDEAAALVETWSHNVFGTYGKRLVYVMSDEAIDAALPVTVEPTPDVHERVYLTRVELFTAKDETELEWDLVVAGPDGASDVLAGLGPFAEPKLRRLAEATEDDQLAVWFAELAEDAALLP